MSQYIEQKIEALIQPILNDFGLEVVDIKFTTSSNKKILTILIEKIDGSRLTINDCSFASRQISSILDVDDSIKDKYYLEVSSAGLERPLIKFLDYNKFLGHSIRTRLKAPLNNCSHYKGKIIKAADNKIELEDDDRIIIIDFDLIKSAHLVITDEKLKKLLK